MSTDKNIKTAQSKPNRYTLLGARALDEVCFSDVANEIYEKQQ